MRITIHPPVLFRARSAQRVWHRRRRGCIHRHNRVCYYHLDGDCVAYQISVRARRAAHAKALLAAVSALPSLLELRLVPTGD
jgi:hypothetical protein